MYRLGNDLRTPFASPKGKRSERGRKAKLLAMFQLTVRGVPCLYYGEEIGMTDSKFPFATALDPIPHRFTFAPRFVFDMLGTLLNRDEVRTPMQWNAARNSGFSSAQTTWLPVHGNYPAVNVEKQQAEPDSLLNTVRTLLKIRRQEKCLQEGGLELLENLPKGVLGYARMLEGKRILILLNFDDQAAEFRIENSGKLFNLSAGDRADGTAIHLAGYGGLTLQAPFAVPREGLPANAPPQQGRPTGSPLLGRPYVYFNFSSTIFATFPIASFISAGSGRLPWARLGRPPPRPPMAAIRSPAFKPLFTTSSVTTEITVVPEAITAAPFLEYLSRNLSASERNVSAFAFETSAARKFKSLKTRKLFRTE